jgi:hypothetical protein
VPTSPTCYMVFICIGAANLEPSDKYLPVVASVDVISREHSCHHSKSHYTISNIQVKQSIVNPKVRHVAVGGRLLGPKCQNLATSRRCTCAATTMKKSSSLATKNLERAIERIVK